MGWAKQAAMDRDKDNFLMDFENWCLEHRWDARKGIPTGPYRYEDTEWATMMKKECEFSDTFFEEYCEWCSQGGGDEWFQEEEIEVPQPTILQRLSEIVNAPIIFRSDSKYSG